MGWTKVNNTEMKEFKPTPTLELKGKIGNYVEGVVKKHIKPDFFGNAQVILTVEDTNGSTILYDKETKTNKEVSIKAGDDVFFVLSSTGLKDLQHFEEGEAVRVVYNGQANPTKVGRKGFHKFDILRKTGE